MFSVLVIRLRSLRLLRVSGIVMRLRMFLLLITFLKASHSFRNRLLVICKNAYLFATMIIDRLEAFYDNPNALRDYFRDIGRMVLAAEGRKANDSHADCYQYFCVPEYGTANGRLHFHAVYFMRTLPTGSVDPNFGRRVRNRRQLNSLQNTWPYGYSMPIAVRYTQDAFSRSGWLWPVDAKGEPLKATSYMAVGFYVAKYVNKKSDMDLAA